MVDPCTQTTVLTNACRVTRTCVNQCIQHKRPMHPPGVLHINAGAASPLPAVSIVLPLLRIFKALSRAKKPAPRANNQARRQPCPCPCPYPPDRLRRQKTVRLTGGRRSSLCCRTGGTRRSGRGQERGCCRPMLVATATFVARSASAASRATLSIRLLLRRQRAVKVLARLYSSASCGGSGFTM